MFAVFGGEFVGYGLSCLCIFMCEGFVFDAFAWMYWSLGFGCPRGVALVAGCCAMFLGFMLVFSIAFISGHYLSFLLCGYLCCSVWIWVTYGFKDMLGVLCVSCF